jgi:uncharacterized membrane protein
LIQRLWEYAVKELLITATSYATLAIDALALIIIAAGTIEAFFGWLLAMVSSVDGHKRRDIWLRYGRCLVAGLTFQLAADIIESATAPSWTDIGRLAAIAVIRTFLNYFLERDLAEVRERQRTTVTG